MTKKDESLTPEEATEVATWERSAAQDVVAGAPPLYGNENYQSTPPRVNTLHTREEWLAEATPAMETMERGDHVSPRLIEDLFHDAYHVIDEFVPPAARGAKNEKNEKR